jgi:hypothetical protein
MPALPRPLVPGDVPDTPVMRNAALVFPAVQPGLESAQSPMAPQATQYTQYKKLLFTGRGACIRFPPAGIAQVKDAVIIRVSKPLPFHALIRSFQFMVTNNSGVASFAPFYTQGVYSDDVTITTVPPVQWMFEVPWGFEPLRCGWLSTNPYIPYYVPLHFLLPAQGCIIGYAGWNRTGGDDGHSCWFEAVEVVPQS